VILVFDVGNTEMTIGLFREAELRHWRIMTDVARTPDEFGVLLRSLIVARGFNAMS
jgi:type III pantothenate kinase